MSSKPVFKGPAPIYAWVDHDGIAQEAEEISLRDLQRATLVIVGPNDEGKYYSTKNRYEDNEIYPNQITAWVTLLGTATRRKEQLSKEK